jgi:hypothetical protein
VLDNFVRVVVVDRQQLGDVPGGEAHLVEVVVGFHKLLHLEDKATTRFIFASFAKKLKGGEKYPKKNCSTE